MKSGVSFFRKHLGKGKSEHSGRGFYVFRFQDNSVTTKQIISMLKEKLPGWKEKGLVKNVEEDDNHFVVELSDEHFNQYYKTFRVSKKPDVHPVFRFIIGM